ncbi:MAG: hypothetical protein KBF45_15390 [Cyclobacteriaceae bacterium]|nr:hypothetical protein [Cyclobacteriaceae bacterium]
MRLLLCLFSLSLFLPLGGCSDNEPEPMVSLGLNVPQNKIDDVQKKFDLLQSEFEKIKSARNIIPDEEQTDAGFMYLDLLEGKVQTSEKLSVNLDGLSIEDAVMLMFMLIAEDARQDVKDLLLNMDSQNKQKKKLQDAVSTWNVSLLDFQKALKDVALHADDVQQVLFTDTTLMEVNVPSGRAACFALNGQEGSVTQLSITSKSGQTPPILFELEDMATDDVLFSETTSNDFSHSNTLKKNTFMRICLKLVNESDVTIPITLRIIHTKKVVSKPKPVTQEVGSVVRDLAETMRAELQKLNDEFENLYKSQFISAAEGQALNTIVGLSVNRFGYLSDPQNINPLIYKYPTKTNTYNELGEQDLESVMKLIDRRGIIDDKMSAILKKIGDTQNAITENLK